MEYELIHHGGHQGVTGSCHELVLDPLTSVLIDCGLFQGAETAPDGRAGSDDATIRFAVGRLVALIVTHVHIDHVGRIPYLLAAGYKGPILCTEPSARLLPIVLADAFAIGFSRDKKLIERYLQLLESRLLPLPYRTWYPLIERPALKCRVRLQPAGHILGSCFVELDIDRRDLGRKHRVLFSGDLGAPHTPILAAPRSPWHADTVVLESTYGDRIHESRTTRRQRLKSAVEHALRDGGTVMVPAFSIGRTQELLYEIEDILHREAHRPGPGAERWRNLPIYLDSPLASRFTTEYRRLNAFWDREAIARLRAGRAPLSFDRIVAIDDHTAHLANATRLARTGEPAIVIAASGMCTGGRIVNYLKHMLDDPRHDVLFVGYQAAGTPGRTIQIEGPRHGQVALDGQRITIRARIHTVSGYSAHADRDDLTRFITRMRHLPKEIRLVHGEQRVRQAFAKHLEGATGGMVRVVP